MLTITPLHPLFAARISGLDLAQDLDDATFATVRDAFERYSVLVFPGQTITDAQQVRFSERFGPLEVTRAGANGAGSKLIVLTNIAADGCIVAPTDKQVLSHRADQIWHTDSSFKPLPARASLLSAREIPSRGGDTQYASMRAAYAALPDEDKRRVDGLVAVHDFTWSRSRVDPTLVTDAERADHPPVRQAVVMDSPNGKALYLGAHARFIDGMDEAESRALIDRLIAFGTQERFVY
ncbi:MAG: TauD/TfdA family dioxygenase, partial [Alphaproteobacteria bacterium]|nr:TauD/TfdA family dioxygenase [Alphaproteobacteria bacterium]